MVVADKPKKNEKSVVETIGELTSKGLKALEQFRKLDQDQVNTIVKEMALAGLDNHMTLARMAIDETKRGVYEDKITKIFSLPSIFITISSMIVQLV